MLILQPVNSMSHEEFYAYWRDEHTQIFPTIPIVKKNLLDYEQVWPSFLRHCRSLLDGGLTVSLKRRATSIRRRCSC